MEPLVLEYVLTGSQRGYNFTSPTRGYDENTLKRIWRTAMPRGHGWGQAVYAGARSIKCFPLDERRVAVSTVTVTDQQDESGRKGIRRAHIQVMAIEACAIHLQAHLRAYPYLVQRQIERTPSATQWAQLVSRFAPMFGKSDQQVIFTREFDVETWAVIEGTLIKLALGLSSIWKRGAAVVPFTTLALDAREEMTLVGIPAGSVKAEMDRERLVRL